MQHRVTYRQPFRVVHGVHGGKTPIRRRNAYTGMYGLRRRQTRSGSGQRRVHGLRPWEVRATPLCELHSVSEREIRRSCKCKLRNLFRGDLQQRHGED